MLAQHPSDLRSVACVRVESDSMHELATDAEPREIVRTRLSPILSHCATVTSGIFKALSQAAGSRCLVGVRLEMAIGEKIRDADAKTMSPI